MNCTSGPDRKINADIVVGVTVIAGISGATIGAGGALTTGGAVGCDCALEFCGEQPLVSASVASTAPRRKNLGNEDFINLPLLKKLLTVTRGMTTLAGNEF